MGGPSDVAAAVAAAAAAGFRVGPKDGRHSARIVKSNLIDMLNEVIGTKYDPILTKAEDLFKSDDQFPADSDDSDSDEAGYIVESIDGDRTTPSGSKEYRVKWVGYSEKSWEPEENCGQCKVRGLCILFASCTNRKPDSRLTSRQVFARDNMFLSAHIFLACFVLSSPYVLQDAIAEYHRRNEIPQAPTTDAAPAAGDGDCMSSDDEAYNANGASGSDDDSGHESAVVGGSSKDAVAGGGGGGDDSGSSSGVDSAEDGDSGSDCDGDEGPIKSPKPQRKRAGIDYTCLNYMLYGVDNVSMPAYSPTIMLKLVRMSAARLMQHPLAPQKNQAKLKEEEEADSDYEGA
jgi:hypothetical protein